ncbi:SRPBCC family protein [Devosia sp.]|uniref:SRPBCC family protein n=1 Tax=Devosia sp. TaxID=1871048 RepID=UPI003A908102
MTDTETKTRSVVIERELPHPPSKIWRALTQPQLMAEWLMKTDFVPELGHRFAFTEAWGSVDCEVLEIAPEEALSYSWNGMGLESTVTWTLTPTDGGTHLRMEQAGFRIPEQKQAYGGAASGWARFLDQLEQVVDGLA